MSSKEPAYRKVKVIVNLNKSCIKRSKEIIVLSNVMYKEVDGVAKW